MQRDNFLLIVKPWRLVHWFWLLFFGIGIGILANISLLSVAIIFSVLFVILLAVNFEVGLIGMLIIGFFHSWEIDFAVYSWARDIPYLPTINAPVVDFLAVILLSAVLIIGLLNQKWFRERIKELWRVPGFFSYLLFLTAAFVSAFLAYHNGDVLAFKSWWRPYMFVYAAFVLPFIFNNKNNTAFIKFFRVLCGVGIGVAIFGALSLLTGQSGDAIWRVTPFAIFGFAPLGYNHNLLAEVLVTTVPAFLVLAGLQTGPDGAKKFYIYSLVGVVIITLLTLSRAAWLALMVTFGVWFWIHHQKNIIHFLVKKNQWLVAVAAVFFMSIAGYMVYFLGTGTALSSTAARFDVTRVVALYVQRQPWFGYGPGSYIDVVGDTALLQLEYGDALDAHGFVQKIILETGVVGLFLFIFFLGIIIRALYQVVKKTTSETERLIFSGLFAMVTGSVVFQLFNTSYFNSVFWIPIGLASAALVYHKNKSSYGA